MIDYTSVVKNFGDSTIPENRNYLNAEKCLHRALEVEVLLQNELAIPLYDNSKKAYEILWAIAKRMSIAVNIQEDGLSDETNKIANQIDNWNKRFEEWEIKNKSLKTDPYNSRKHILANHEREFRLLDEERKVLNNKSELIDERFEALKLQKIDDEVEKLKDVYKKTEIIEDTYLKQDLRLEWRNSLAKIAKYSFFYIAFALMLLSDVFTTYFEGSILDFKQTILSQLDHLILSEKIKTIVILILKYGYHFKHTLVITVAFLLQSLIIDKKNEQIKANLYWSLFEKTKESIEKGFTELIQLKEEFNNLIGQHEDLKHLKMS